MRKLFLLLGVLPFIVYLRTLAPTITWSHAGVDSGDLATAVAVGGVPHPPGYPTYLLMGEIFKRLPVGDIAYRLNLLSAACAALAVALTALVIAQSLMHLAERNADTKAGMSKERGLARLCAAAAALSLAFSGSFWSQAVIAEVYTLNTLLAALLLYGAIHLRPANQRWLVPGLFGLLGVALGNHPTILLLLPVLVWRLNIRWRWLMAASTLAAFGLGLSVYLILPLRAAGSPPVNWGAAATWPGFLWLVGAQPYRHFVFGLSPQFLPGRIAAECHLLIQGFMGWGVPVGLLGLWRLTHADRHLGYGSLLSFLLFSAYAIGYDTTDSYVYLLPVLLLFSLWIGWGLYTLATALGRLGPAASQAYLRVAGLLLLLPCLSLAWNFARQDLSRDTQAYDYARRTLELAAPHAVILAEGDPQTFALWYAHYALNLRPDVAVVSVDLLPYAWYRATLCSAQPHLCLTDQAEPALAAPPLLFPDNASALPVYQETLQAPLRESSPSAPTCFEGRNVTTGW
jgi:hypothetical protein